MYDRLEEQTSRVTASIDHGHTEGRRLEKLWRPHDENTFLKVMEASRAGDLCLTDVEAAWRAVHEALAQNEEAMAAYGSVRAWLANLAQELEELYAQEGGVVENLGGIAL